MKHQIAEDVHAAERHGLRDGPLHCASGGRNRESFHSAPERAGCVVAGQGGVRVYVADDVDRLGHVAQADDFGIETHGYIDVVFAGKEEQRVARGAKLAVLLDGIDLVDLLLNLRRGHAGIEDQNVGAEVGSWSAVQLSLRRNQAGGTGEQSQRDDQAGQSMSSGTCGMKCMHEWWRHLEAHRGLIEDQVMVIRCRSRGKARTCGIRRKIV